MSELTLREIDGFCTEPTPEEAEAMGRNLAERVERETLARIYENNPDKEKA